MATPEDQALGVPAFQNMASSHLDSRIKQLFHPKKAIVNLACSDGYVAGRTVRECNAPIYVNYPSSVCRTCD
jgi:hypothetical protein